MLEAITDDEAVALAIEQRGAWAGVLPTVDVDNVDALGAALLRGRRSLLVRRLIDTDGRLTADAALVAGAGTRTDRSITIYIGNTSLVRVGWGVAATFWPTADGWLAEGVTPEGVHRLSILDTSEVRASLDALIEAAQSTPIADDDEAEPARAWLCIGSRRHEKTSVLAVRPGASQSAEVTASGDPSDWRPVGEADAAGWLTAATD